MFLTNARITYKIRSYHSLLYHNKLEKTNILMETIKKLRGVKLKDKLDHKCISGKPENLWKIFNYDFVNIINLRRIKTSPNKT